MTTALLEQRTATRVNTGTVSVKLDADYRERLRRLAQSQIQARGYMLLYHYTANNDTVTLLAMKHQLENDYK